MAVNLVVDTKAINRVAIDLREVPKEMPKAVMQAVNRTVDHVYTHTSREVRKEYAISDKDVKSTLKKVKASSRNAKAGVIATGRTLTLYNHFRVTPKQPKPGGRYKVKVAIKKGKSQELKTNPKPFIASANRSTQVFKREGPERTPVVVLRSLSVPQMIAHKDSFTEAGKRIQTLADKKLAERIEHEVNRRMEKLHGSEAGK